MTELSSLHLFITCPKGLEYLLEEEAAAMGAEVLKTTPAGVHVRAGQGLMMELCMWSRLANRVLLELADTVQADRDGLYQMARSVDWGNYLRPGEAYWIAAFGSAGEIRHSGFGAQVIKDAISDHFRERNLEPPEIGKDKRGQVLQLNLGKTITLGLDLCGRSLHQRGYRQEGEAAPLKENLAAALLIRAGWPTLCGEQGVFVDPMCGSGTLVIEAAMMAMDMAPGLLNPDFALRHAPWFSEQEWVRVVSEAQERFVLGKRRWHGSLQGSDLNPKAIQAARRNLARTGMDRWVSFESGDALSVAAPDVGENVGKLLLTNPPYGERLGQELELRGLYQNFGRNLKRSFNGWKVGVFTSNAHLARELGVRAHKQYRFFNGKLPTTLFLFDIYTQALPSHDKAREEQGQRTISEQARMFANRLQKNQKKLRKWAEKNHIEAYRLYDADIPEYAVAVDCYGKAACIQEYAAPRTVDEEKAHQRLLDVLEVVPQVLDIPASSVFLKQRRKQKGAEQYQRLDRQSLELTVSEHGCRFQVNLSDYLDTGLFLDHRPMRYYVQQHARGKRFLNLFCYTGAASVHAALGGARSTTSVDLSQTYLAWAERNFALNHISLGEHRFIRADVMQWLKTEKSEYDLIFLDPPTFSNSKKMSDVLDIQRDHVELVTQCMRLLAKGGLLIFSNNFRRFKLDEGLQQAFRVEDKTRESLPEDFARNHKIHQCWFISHHSS